MGRAEKSQGLAPPTVRKDQRARLARQIITKTIPAILASNARARNGSEGSELFVHPGLIKNETEAETKEKNAGETDVVYIKRKGQGRRKVKIEETNDEHEKQSKGVRSKGKKKKSDELDMTGLSLKPATTTTVLPKPRIRIIITDTLTAAHMLAFPAKYPSPAPSCASSSKLPSTAARRINPCILNMASPLRPGGGVLAGATSQEEFLCARTTLLPSLRESFYRLPEIGGVWTHDVLVFRGAGGLGEGGEELSVVGRWWVDVVSAGMLRFPELEGGEVDGGEGKGRLGKRDREIVEEKMRAVLRIAKIKGVRRLVLGAWGCGAYGNPVEDVARAWRKVLDGNGVTSMEKRKGAGAVERMQWGFEDVVFAITNENMAREFSREFGGGLEVEAGPGSVVDEQDDEEDEIAEELREKIKEINGQIDKVWNPELRERLGNILEGLKKQLEEREKEGNDGHDGHDGEDDSESVDEGEEHEESTSEVDEESDEDEYGGCKLPSK